MPRPAKNRPATYPQTSNEAGAAQCDAGFFTSTFSSRIFHGAHRCSFRALPRACSSLIKDATERFLLLPQPEQMHQKIRPETVYPVKRHFWPGFFVKMPPPLVCIAI
jgi:hypothetical protein